VSGSKTGPFWTLFDDEEWFMEELTRFGVSIRAKLLERFDTLISQKGYVNRSEAIRDLIRKHLVEHEWEQGDTETFGTLTIVYNRHVRELAERLEHFQHDHYLNVISTLHIHLDEHNCLEVMVLRGMPAEIRTLADHILGVKGVKHGQFVMTTSGKELD
jgi:CopG family nickel-responsive transcriptional regulator